MKKILIIFYLALSVIGCKENNVHVHEEDTMTHYYRSEVGTVEVLNRTEHSFINNLKITTKSESLERFFFNGSSLNGDSTIKKCIPFPLTLSKKFEELKEAQNIPEYGMYVVAPPKDENSFRLRGPYGCIPRVPLKQNNADSKAIVKFHYKRGRKARVFIPMAAALHLKSDPTTMRETIPAYGMYFSCDETMANEIEKIILGDNDATIGIDSPPTADSELFNLLVIPKMTIYFKDKQGNEKETSFTSSL